MPRPIASRAVGTLAALPTCAEVDAGLAAIVREEGFNWPDEWRGPETRGKVLDRVDYHGLSRLLAAQIDRLEDWPLELRTSVLSRARIAAVWELRHRWMLDELTSALAQAGVETLILKGSALAYTLYADPWLRERGDSDLLIRSSDRDRAREVLTALGFHRLGGNLWPETQRFQENWERTFEDGLSHTIDLHFDLFNSPVLNGMVPFEDCWSDRQSLAAVGPSAFAPGRPILLYHACLHRETNRVARYFAGGLETTGANRLLWLKDIDLLAASLTDDEWDAFTGWAIRTRQAEACLAGVHATAHRLKTVFPTRVSRQLTQQRRKSSPYLRRGQIGRAIADVASVPGIAQRLRYTQARLFPEGQSIRFKYASEANQPIARLYMRRIVEVLRRSFGSGTD